MGRNDRVFADHADERPTILSLVGLEDSYVSDGRVVVDVLGERGHDAPLLRELGAVYKQLNAPFGQFSLDTLKVSTVALASDDARYNRLEDVLTRLGARRDVVASRIKNLLLNAEFKSHDFDQRGAIVALIEARLLLVEAQALAAITH
jgi:hypothetical protein